MTHHFCANQRGVMTLYGMISAVGQWLGIERNQTSHSEKIISAAGAFVGIGLTLLLSMWMMFEHYLGIHGSLMIISSMGATAVLIFAVPHGALSQPWPVIGGHLISAFIGVSCQKFLPAGFVTAGMAVGLAVGAMYYLRCVHPPGGATALTAVVGGSEVIEMGYGFLVYPVLLNLVVMLLAGFLFNILFKWRRYPAHFSTRHIKDEVDTLPIADYLLTTEDFHAAVRDLDSFVDITEEGLTELLQKAKQHAEQNVQHPQDIISGRYYSNGHIGNMWRVRQVIDDAGNAGNDRELIIYKTVAGQGAYETGYCSRQAFRNWARFEVREEKGLWVKQN